MGIQFPWGDAARTRIKARSPTAILSNERENLYRLTRGGARSSKIASVAGVVQSGFVP
jgi:hypothetical protein